MRTICVFRDGGREMYINPMNILYIERCGENDERTRIVFIGGNSLVVDNTMKCLNDMIRGIKGF